MALSDSPAERPADLNGPGAANGAGHGLGDGEPAPPAAGAPPSDRVRASWDTRSEPSPGPRMVGRIMVGAALGALAWQLATRAAGLDAAWSPSALLERLGERMRPLAFSLAQFVAQWTDLLSLLRRALDVLLRPIGEECWKLVSGVLSFFGGLAGETVRGFLGGVPNAFHAVLASTTALFVGSSILVALEAIGLLTRVMALRPSFWIVSCGNALYETSRAWTSFFCVQVRLMFEFRDTVLALLRRIPGFEALWRIWDRAGRFLGTAFVDLMRAIPKGFRAAVRFFFDVPGMVRHAFGQNAASADANANGPPMLPVPAWYADAPIIVGICMLAMLVLAAAAFTCSKTDQCLHRILA